MGLVVMVALPIFALTTGDKGNNYGRWHSQRRIQFKLGSSLQSIGLYRRLG